MLCIIKISSGSIQMKIRLKILSVNRWFLPCKRGYLGSGGAALLPIPLSSASCTLEKQIQFILCDQCAKQFIRLGAIGLGHCYWEKNDKYLKLFLPAWRCYILHFLNNFSTVWFNEQVATTKNIFKNLASAHFSLR